MFESEEVVRDENGFWMHSAFRGDDAVERDITTLPVSEGMQFNFVSFEADALENPQAPLERSLLEGGSEEDYFAAVRQWEPTRPDGEGWFLVGIYDTEDGPYACFARPAATEEQG